jgi:predicted nucleic acid-binding protein
MPNANSIVIDTSLLISLIAALGDLNVLATLYQQVLVPWEVGQELQKGGARGFAVAEFEQATFLKKWLAPLEIPPFLTNTLDRGEAAVIQLALTERIATVCIDEASGWRVARLHGLSLTGTVGILIRAKREGYPFAMPQAIAQMRKPGIWLSERVIRVALEQGH